MRNCKTLQLESFFLFFFFFFARDLYLLFFIQGVFKSHQKSPPPKVPIPIQLNVLKNGSAPPAPKGGGGANYVHVTSGQGTTQNTLYIT